MHRWILLLAMLATALWSVPALAQSRAQLGPLCTSEGTPVDQQIDACNKIIALKVFSGEKLATIYFWRAVGWNKKGDYAHVIEDTTEALLLQPGQIAFYNMRGSAYYDKGAADWPAQRHDLSQSRQRLARQGKLSPRDRRLR